ncbi:HAD family hydrolase [Bacillus sp. 22475]|uniref:HAD family hydrolase n=1 Tax=Bacillus TaxID=1386 RepID=UPI000BFC3CBE|nr:MULTISPECIES: HAD family phosphatase [Bacillus]PGN40926.1 HAD family hydrolase [Bacillus thuringiensis]HDR4555899.1 HAD family phosphatase [Bacillus cereus]
MNNNKLSIDQIKLVIFDMDGLMFDTERLGIEGWKYAFEHFGLPIPMSILIKKIGLNSVDSRKLFDEEIKYEFDYKSVKEVKREYVINYIREHGTPIKKGLLELLDFLDENNIKKVVATSRSEKMAGFYLSEAKIQHRFDAIITGDMVSKGKPNPDIFIHASKLFNYEPENCIVLEDSLNGINAAVNAKMIPVMIPDLVHPNEEIEKLIYEKNNTLIEVIDLFA